MLAALCRRFSAISFPRSCIQRRQRCRDRAGCVLGLSPSIGTLLLLIWLGAVAIWRYSSGARSPPSAVSVVAIVNEQRQEFLIFAIVVSDADLGQT